MPCIDIPIPELPSLPVPLGFATPTPSLTTPSSLLCCNIPAITVVAPGIAVNVPAQALTAIMAVLAANRKALIAWLASIEPPCPRQ